MSVCAVIPCGRRHIGVVDQAVRSILSQTMPVATISVRFSSMKRCPPRHATFPVDSRIVSTCTTKKETTGMVRNLAVSECRGEDYITFIDSDDIALPYAVQRIISLMRRNNASVGIHDYFPKHQGKVVRNHTELKPHFLPGKLPPFNIDAHMAHSTVRRDVFTPQRNLTIGEDSWFINDLWTRNATFVYTAEKLTMYMDRTPRAKFDRASVSQTRLVRKRRKTWREWLAAVKRAVFE